GELRGPPFRDPLRDVVRGGAAPLSARDLPAAAAPALQGVLAFGVGRGPRGGADGRADRDGRGVPRRGGGGARLRTGAGRRRGGAGGGARGDVAVVRAGRRVVQGRGEDR